MRALLTFIVSSRDVVGSVSETSQRMLSNVFSTSGSGFIRSTLGMISSTSKIV